MTAKSITRVPQLMLTAIVLVGSLFIAPGARAEQQSGTLSVTASVVSTLNLTLYDTTVNFGGNLSSLGPQSDSNDTVWNSDAGPYVYYRWRPFPDYLRSTLASVTSSTPWSITYSMLENGGSSPDLRLDEDDFRLGFGGACDAGLRAEDIDNLQAIHADGPHLFHTGSGGAEMLINDCFFLRVEAGDAPGSFASTITVTVSN